MGVSMRGCPCQLQLNIPVAESRTSCAIHFLLGEAPRFESADAAFVTVRGREGAAVLIPTRYVGYVAIDVGDEPGRRKRRAP